MPSGITTNNLILRVYLLSPYLLFKSKKSESSFTLDSCQSQVRSGPQLNSSLSNKAQPLVQQGISLLILNLPNRHTDRILRTH